MLDHASFLGAVEPGTGITSELPDIASCKKSDSQTAYACRSSCGSTALRGGGRRLTAAFTVLVQNLVTELEPEQSHGSQESVTMRANVGQEILRERSTAPTPGATLAQRKHMPARWAQRHGR